jgi:hypothetical protein
MPFFDTSPTSQGDQANLAVDIQRCQAQEGKQQRPGNGQRYGTRENDERIAEALKLRRQHEIDQNSRQQEGGQKLAALNPHLARFSRVIDRETPGQDALGLVFQQTQRPVQWNPPEVPPPEYARRLSCWNFFSSRRRSSSFTITLWRFSIICAGTKNST